MQVFTGMKAYDLVILGLFVLLVGRGMWLGLLRQVTGFIALYLGYFVASRYHDRILPLLRDISENPKIVFLASCVILFVITYVVVMLVGKAMGYVIQMTISGWFDHLLGAVVGFAKAVILAVLLHMVLGTVLAPENQMLRTCVTCDILNEATDFTRTLIRDEDVRKSLLQQKPAIAIDAVKELLTPATQELAAGKEIKIEKPVPK